jgi:hypothetical protein
MRALVGAIRSICWRNWFITVERFSDHPVGLAGAGLERLDLAPHLLGFQRAGRNQHQPVGLERLFDEIIGAALDGRHGGFDVAVAGDHHHRQVRVHAA